jgi:hypothetical protein
MTIVSPIKAASAPDKLTLEERADITEWTLDGLQEAIHAGLGATITHASIGQTYFEIGDRAGLDYAIASIRMAMGRVMAAQKRLDDLVAPQKREVAA